MQLPKRDITELLQTHADLAWLKNILHWALGHQLGSITLTVYADSQDVETQFISYKGFPPLHTTANSFTSQDVVAGIQKAFGVAPSPDGPGGHGAEEVRFAAVDDRSPHVAKLSWAHFHSGARTGPNPLVWLMTIDLDPHTHQDPIEIPIASVKAKVVPRDSSMRASF